MQNEWLMILAMALGGVLFAAGGTGFKWMRRFVLPITLGLIAFFSGIIWWKCAIFAVAQCITLHLGYGESKPYWYKALVGASYAIPSLIFGLTVWQLITPVIFLSMFWLSNQAKTAKYFVWKVCEFSFGLLIAITFITATIK